MKKERFPCTDMQPIKTKDFIKYAKEQLKTKGSCLVHIDKQGYKIKAEKL